jgi:hypothetical protein
MKFKIYSTSILLSLSFLFVFTNKAEALIPVTVPFGGPILMTYECTCSGSWFVLMYDYTTMLPVPMVFRFGESALRANYNIFTPMTQTLGSYSPDGGVCLLASLDCGGFTTEGTITPGALSGIGTGSY